MPPFSWATTHGSYRPGKRLHSCAHPLSYILKVRFRRRKYGIPEVGQNTCVGLLFGATFFKKLPDGLKGKTSLEACMVGMHLADDLGIWSNYGQLQRDFKKLYYDGIIKKNLDGREFQSYSWKKYEEGDPSFLFEMLPGSPGKEG